MKVGNLHDGVAFLAESFVRDILAISGNSTGFSLIICNYAIAIIKYSTASIGTSNSIFKLRHRGITNIPFVFSVLLKLIDVVQVEMYIEDAYNIYNRAYPPYFQIQFLLVNINESGLRVIKFCQINLFRSIKRKKSKKKVLQKKCRKKRNKLKEEEKRQGIE